MVEGLKGEEKLRQIRGFAHRWGNGETWEMRHYDDPH